MAPGRAATILHADLDAFYASVEQLLDPSLRHRPIAVGEGVVLAASYEARAYGVSSGMSGTRAKRLCPGLTFVAGHFRQYQELGDRVVKVLGSFTPAVERVSIDEAFLDVAGARRLFGSPADIAAAIRHRVRTEVGLAISVGVARTKHLAKVASQVAKPDGLVVVPADGEEAFLEHLPVELVWGVGPATRARLADAGIHTIGQLAATPGASLGRMVGAAAGSKLGALASNVDVRPVARARPARSVGAQAALGRAVPTPDLVRTTLGYLADRVAGRMRAAGRAGRTVAVRVRFADMRAVTRSLTLAQAVSCTLTLSELATDLALGALHDHPQEPRITLLAVSVANLVPDATLQLELPLPAPGDARLRPGSDVGAARSGVDRSVDAVRSRFGHGAVGYAGTVFSETAVVPDAFRELAERRLAQDSTARPPTDRRMAAWRRFGVSTPR